MNGPCGKQPYQVHVSKRPSLVFAIHVSILFDGAWGWSSQQHTDTIGKNKFEESWVRIMRQCEEKA